MTKRVFSVLPVLLLAALQVGCVGMSSRAEGFRSPPVALNPACDTSVRYIDLATRLRNDFKGDIEFNLVGDRGPVLDLWYMGYRVYASAPGEPFRLVHNSGQDAAWTRKVAIPTGNWADFNTPIFGLRPGDYYRYFRIELRDSKTRSYWTPVFDLCSVPKAICGCPRLGAMTAVSQTPQQACPTAAAGSVVKSCDAQ